MRFSVLMPEQPLAGAVVLVAGLNMKPSCLLELAGVWLEVGYAVVLTILRGHAPQSSAEEWAAVSAEDWLRDVAACRREAARLALDKPVWLCGFSLGAAVGLAEYLQATRTSSCSSPHYTGMILCSPAIRLRPWAHSVRLLFHWPRLRLASLAGRRYRVHDHTSLAAYRALFVLRARIKVALASYRRSAAGVALPPLCVIYDGWDLLTAGRALGRWFPREAAIVYQRVHAKNLWHHLITDRRALGDAAWQELSATIRRMLEVSKGPANPVPSDFGKKGRKGRETLSHKK